MKHESKIKGDGNFVFQGIKKSKIDIQNGNHSDKPKIGWIGILIAAIGVIVTIIVGWDEIIKFFTK